MTAKVSSSERTGGSDPFLITSNDTLGLLLMRGASLLPNGGTDLRATDGYLYNNRNNILPGLSRGEHIAAARAALTWERLWMGLLGGLALIAPMLIMVLHKDLLTTLLTASVATVLFAGAMALLASETRGETVLAAVAAYAAVLVVFVGATS